MSAHRLGHDGLLIPSDAPVSLWDHLRKDPPAGVVDIVAGAASVLLIYDPSVPSPLPEPVDVTRLRPTARRLVELPVAYDGPDLADVAGMAGLDVSDVGAVHSQPLYAVTFIGFSPGFAYLTGTDVRLDVPRLERPRTSVPAGSVAIAAGQTAVYPQPTPGGWRLIGRTDAVLFDPRADPPCLLQPGDRVRFLTSGSVGTAPGFRPPSLLPRDRQGPRLEVLDVGARLTIQDGGRPGWAHAGVPRGGAADRASAGLANALVGNSSDLALLEVTLGGGRIRVMAERAIAVTGAPCELSVDGLPARVAASLHVPAAAEVVIGPAKSGVHTYLAVAGGIEVEPVLGSRSTDTLSGLGPRPLIPGDVVGVGSARVVSTPRPRPTSIPGPDSEVTVRATPGPFELGRSHLAAASWEVGPDSDRTGARLVGPAIPALGTVASMGMVAGAVQVPPGGQPVVLLRNHPVTGGYPVVAVVDDAGVDLLAQCRPGTRIRFELRW